jgi:membrane protease YdiL (CAAX protease family)
MFDARHVGALGYVHLALFCVIIPVLTIRSRRIAKSRGAFPPRKQHYASTLIEQCTFLAISLVVARGEWIPIFAPYAPRWIDIAIGVGVLCVLVAFMRPRWKRAVEKRVPVVELFSPRGALEHTLWASIALLAGIGEEITYRGVMYALLWRLTGSAAVAVAIGALVFGASHMLQGWRSSLVIVGFALAFQAIVLITGTLYVAMAVHCLYDVIAGLSYARLVRERDSAALPSAPAA